MQKSRVPEDYDKALRICMFAQGLEIQAVACGPSPWLPGLEGYLCLLLLFICLLLTSFLSYVSLQPEPRRPNRVCK